MGTQFLVQMALAAPGRSASPQEGVVFIERYIIPTLEACERLAAGGKLVAGGPGRRGPRASGPSAKGSP